MRAELWWLAALVLLKPLLTSLTLSGGGSGGIFAPSLFLGASLGGTFGLVCNLLIPEFSANKSRPPASLFAAIEKYVRVKSCKEFARFDAQRK